IQEGKESVASLRNKLEGNADLPPSPEDLWQLAGEFGYELEMNWAGDLNYHVVLRRAGKFAPAAEIQWPAPRYRSALWHQYVNVPSITGKFRLADTQTTQELKKYLQERLPEYMVPALYVLLEKMPLSANGKVDRKALPRPEISIDEAKYVAPRNSVETALCAIWSQVLGLERVGVEDNFFEAGGDSIRSIQVVVRTREA